MLIQDAPGNAMAISLPVNLGLVRELRHVHPFCHVNVQEECDGTQSAKRTAHEHIWRVYLLPYAIPGIKCTSFSTRAAAVVSSRVTREPFRFLLYTGVPTVIRRLSGVGHGTRCRGHARGDVIISSRDVLLGLKRTKRLMMLTRRERDCYGKRPLPYVPFFSTIYLARWLIQFVTICLRFVTLAVTRRDFPRKRFHGGEDAVEWGTNKWARVTFWMR